MNFLINYKVEIEMKNKKIEILQKVSNGELTPEQANEQLSGLSIVDISLRDFFAAEVMKAEIISWNAEMTDTHRTALLEDMVERYGQTTVYSALAKSSFEMADIMLQERK